METQENPRLLKAREVAERLRLSVATVYRMAAKGEGPPTVPVGMSIRFPEDLLEKWLNERTNLNSLEHEANKES